MLHPKGPQNPHTMQNPNANPPYILFRNLKPPVLICCRCLPASLAAALKSNLQDLTMTLSDERDTNRRQAARARQENSRLIVELSELKTAVDKAAVEVEERSKTAMEGE